MKLFFETALQARIFIALLPMGMLLAACIDVASVAHRSRPIWDVFILISFGVAVVLLLELMKDDGVRLYHLLAVCIGAIIYLCGVGRLWRAVRRKISLTRSKVHQPSVEKTSK